MDINAGSINALTARINLAFSKFIPTVPPQYTQFSQTIPSSAGENFYPRLTELPGLREFIGQRVVHRLTAKDGFSIVNRTFEEAFSVRREDIEDDQYGFLTPIMQQLASNAASLPDQLIFELLENGHKKRGIDGQNFFDADHEGYNKNGQLTGFSNILRPDGAKNEATSPAWYVCNTRQPMRPMIFQTRRPFRVIARTQLTDGAAFHRNEFEWGTDGRCAAGYGLHNYALRSTAPLTAANLGKAIAMMEAQCRRDGTPLNTRPDLIVVPNSLEGDARALLEKDLIPTLAPDGKTWVPGSNPWSGTLKLLVSSYLNPLVGAD